jgi:hypothetical protein
MIKTSAHQSVSNAVKSWQCIAPRNYIYSVGENGVFRLIGTVDYYSNENDLSSTVILKLNTPSHTHTSIS